MKTLRKLRWCDYGCDLSTTLYRLESFLSGYKWNHIALGVQMAACNVLSLVPVISEDIYSKYSKGGPFFVALTVAVVLEPQQGDAIQKLILRIVAIAVSTGLGIACLQIGYALVPAGFLNPDPAPLTSIVCIFFAGAGFLIMVHKYRYPSLSYMWNLMAYNLPIIVIPGLRRFPGLESYNNIDTDPLRRAASVLTGVAIAAVISILLFPVRARPVLMNLVARSLRRIGDLTNWILDDICKKEQQHTGTNNNREENVDEDEDAIHAATTSKEQDRKRRLRFHLEPQFHSQFRHMEKDANNLIHDVAEMESLVQSASTEWQPFSKPVKFPKEQYLNIIRACRMSVGICSTLIQLVLPGTVDLSEVKRHGLAIRKAAVLVSAGYSALSGVVPVQNWIFPCLAMSGRKKKKKGKRGGKNEKKKKKKKEGSDVSQVAEVEKETQQFQLAYESLEEGKLPPTTTSASITSAAVAAATVMRPPEIQDPFASLAPAPSRAPVLDQLDSLQIEEVHLAARNFSMALKHDDGGGGGGGEGNEEGEGEINITTNDYDAGPRVALVTTPYFEGDDESPEDYAERTVIAGLKAIQELSLGMDEAIRRDGWKGLSSQILVTVVSSLAGLAYRAAECLIYLVPSKEEGLLEVFKELTDARVTVHPCCDGSGSGDGG